MTTTDVQKGSTKDRILEYSARLFSEKGFDRVTTREIAKASGINAASIYYYFPSKEDILVSLYDLYSAHLRSKSPDLEKLMLLVEKEPPHEVLMKTEFHFDDEVRQLLDQIIVTATKMLSADPESERFIRENIFEPTVNIVKPLLLYMIKLKKIKEFDVDTFIDVFSYYCFSAAALNRSSFKLEVEQYRNAMSFLFSIVIPI